MECGEEIGAPVVADPTTAGALRVVSASIHPVRGLRITVRSSSCG